MLVFLLAGALLAAPKPVAKAPKKAQAAKGFPAGDIRSFCNDGGTLAVEKSEVKESGAVYSFKENVQRVQHLKSGRSVMVQQNGDLDELLVDEGGKYRRLVSSRAKVQYLIESPDGKKLAVVVVHEKDPQYGMPPSSGLFIFDTTSWVGEQAVKFFGFSGVAWSGDSSLIAVGDYSKLRVLKADGYKQIEVCGVDSVVTPDGQERLNDIGWVDAKTIRFGYQNLNGKQDYVMRLAP
jgi:hypothetical protein